MTYRRPLGYPQLCAISPSPQVCVQPHPNSQYGLTPKLNPPSTLRFRGLNFGGRFLFRLYVLSFALPQFLPCISRSSEFSGGGFSRPCFLTHSGEVSHQPCILYVASLLCRRHGSLPPVAQFDSNLTQIISVASLQPSGSIV